MKVRTTNIKDSFPKFSRIIFEFSKNQNICERTIVDKYVHKLSSWYLEKRLSFAILNVQKATFYAIYEDFGNFTIFKFCPILAVQKVF